MKILIRFLWLLAFGLLAAKLLFSLNIFWQIFNFAFQVDESESMIVAETLMMSRGTDIFGPPTADRFISAPYTPFYYLLNWPVLGLIGPSFKPGRLISLLAAGGIGWLLYRFVTAYATRLGGRPDRLAAGLASLAWGSLGVVGFWSSTVKPDLTALFLSLAGLYLIFTRPVPPPTSPDNNSPRLFRRASADLSQYRRVYGAAVLFALAALTKQTAFAGVLVALLWLVLYQPTASWRLAGRLVLTYLILAFGPMLAMNLLSQGGFWYHIVTVHQLPWSATNYWKFVGAFLQSYQLFALLALAFLSFWLADLFGWPTSQPQPDLYPSEIQPPSSRRKSASKGFAQGGSRGLWFQARNNPGTFIVLYAGVAGGAGLSVGTYGGNHNHLLELAAAGCLALGATFVRLGQWWRTGQAAQRLGLILGLGLICWQGLGLFVGEARVKPAELPGLGGFEPSRSVLTSLQGQFLNQDWLGLEYRAPLDSYKKRLAEIAAFMTNDQGRYIYSDNVSLMLATSKPIFTTDPFTQTHATFYRRWDESKLVQMVEGQAFSLIVLRQPIESRLQAGNAAQDIYLSPGLAQAVLQYYRLACRDTAPIYVPKSRSEFKGCS